jgi:CheY-like chemotaxis protein
MEKIARETFPKNIQIQAVIPSELVLVLGDTTQLHQVVMNLCVNARDAMPQGGTLRLQAENVTFDETYAQMMPEAKAGAYVRIMVADNGTGIAPEILDKIFDPFFTTKEHGKGTGLGLSTVLGIVRSHSGFVQVHSELGQGTRFEVYLPVAAEQPSETTAIELETFPQGQGQTILVVDDEQAVRTALSNVLEHNGYSVLMAGDGAEAIAQFAKHKSAIQAVIIDMVMPYMDGPVAIYAMLRLAPQAKIIGMTGQVSPTPGARSADLQLQGFLNKPFSAGKILTTLDEVLRG